MVRAVMLKSYFSPEWRTDFEDAEAMSTALNRLGYFVPDARTGIVPFDPDHRLFTALRRFQNDHGIFGSGTAHPNDATVKALNAAIESQNESSGSYVWRGVRDGKSRSSHTAREGRVFTWNAPPEGGHPGEDYNCRCWAEPVQMGYKPPSVKQNTYPDAINPVYPELLLLPFLKISQNAIIIAIKAIYKTKKRNSNSIDVTLTEHGNVRAHQRNITLKEIENAVETARANGNITTKMGKYHTPQTIYKGSNGVTVVVESSGRNAGKIITIYRH